MKKMRVHFVGIKGVGMTPLAIIAKEAGFIVTGSDVAQEFITDAALKKVGITPFVGFASDHVGDVALVIFSGAHGGSANIEVKAAQEKRIRVISQGEAVGLFMQGDIFDRNFKGVSVTGTHGKTTTSAMIATVLSQNNFDPSFLIGTGDVGSLGTAGHFGKGPHFIAEADEYMTDPNSDKTIKFMWQHPQIAVVTNIEFDHPDVYASLEDVKKAFSEFVNQLSEKGVLVVCGDDKEIRDILKGYNKRFITYGLNPGNDYVLTRVNISGTQTFFWVSAYGTPVGEFCLRVPGEHNALNALATIIVNLELGLSTEKIKKGLLAFRGSKRRLEFMGNLVTGAEVYDDYAHHPTELKKTLQALRGQYPKKNIVAIFQPHTYSRTKSLFNDFLLSFEYVDSVLVTDIYASLREGHDETISSSMLVDAMKQYHADVLYLPSREDVVKYIDEKRFKSDTVIVTLGAGDVYKIHSELKLR